MITTDICIIGAGPVGLFAVFEAGLLKMRCHLIDALPQVGGQLSEIYPQKPIYDIPGYPEVKAQTLVDNLMDQIAPFKPGFTLGERVESLEKQDDGSYVITTNEGTAVHCQVVVIAGGLGCFEPRKPEITNLEQFEGKGVAYMVKNPELFRDRRVVLAGGGDSALDWTIFLADIAQEVTLIHRSDSFRGAPDSAEKVVELARQGRIKLLLQSNITSIQGNGHLKEVSVTAKDKSVQILAADHLIPLFGLTPKLGPIADWGLHIDKSAISVNTVDYSTNVERIYAIGDINTYPGKLKLILCGFHEAALMCQSAFQYVYPNQKLSFKYTTVNGVPTF
ncbi:MULTISPECIES: NAD(P)/FAD-dependent oxidoreductase [unclassified Spirosoma]|uniref:NAD(P)/FAD-dependent oxidoreductase n=1 Tax=unclassified Spirosoma TaxID=2621999 RepID=UPI00095EE9A5|nr:MULTISPECIES: NAD(P)/FAD-dependent oxidoreductase [unclassified Spirosoma]MBN8820400.1 NAD(P)/FAD-dependent oxidoreductase [Spirosoma sp.]OJW76098.1 MAG: ferredoxin--NADP(+) reductase [Spirosoma sp. 48-14]